MPHLVLEYTGNITAPPNITKLLSSLHSLLQDLAGAELGSCKSRAIELQEYFIGDGSANLAFLHLDIALLAGRSPSIKEQIGNTALRLLEEHFRHSYKNQSLQITVKISDMPTELYFKTTIA